MKFFFHCIPALANKAMVTKHTNVSGMADVISVRDFPVPFDRNSGGCNQCERFSWAIREEPFREQLGQKPSQTRSGPHQRGVRR